jgi:hypothetical protein
LVPFPVGIVCSDGVGPAAGWRLHPASVATSATVTAAAPAAIARRRPCDPLPIVSLVASLPVVITVDQTTLRA